MTYDFHVLTCGDHGDPLPWSFIWTFVSMLAYMFSTLHIQSHLEGAKACLVAFAKFVDLSLRCFHAYEQLPSIQLNLFAMYWPIC